MTDGTVSKEKPAAARDGGEQGRPRKWWRLALIGAVVVALFVTGRLIEVDQYLSAAQDWIRGLGPWGPAVFAGVYVIATLLFLPGTPFTVFAALLFGAGWAYLIMMVATSLSAIIAFLIARYAAKSTVEARLGSTDTFQRLKRLVEEDRRFVIPAIRFLPMFPYSFNNYALGLTGISFRSYLLWSELVFLVMNAVLVLGANALYRALVLGESSWWLIGGATAAGLLVFALGYYFKHSFGAADAS